MRMAPYDPETAPTFRFGPFDLDVAGAELRRQGEVVVLKPKPYQLLRYLVEQRHRTVSNAELLDEVWPDSFVSLTALASALKQVRRALGDDGSSQRMIRTQRGLGYRFLPEVTVARGAKHPAPAPASDEAGPAHSLVDRMAERERLRSALTLAQTGHGQIRIVTGDPGVGKTALCQEIVREGRELGIPALASWSDEGSGVPAYWAFTRLLRTLQRSRPANWLGECMGTQARFLAPVLPEIAGPETTEPDAGNEGRFRLLDALSTLLERVAEPDGLIVFVDDLQWADASSLWLIDRLARDAGRARILWLLTCRSSRPELDAEPDPRLEQSLERLTSHSYGASEPLGGLSAAATGQLIEQLSGVDLSDDQRDLLHEATEGNPMFAREVATVLKTEEGAAWLAGEEADDAIPLRLREAVTRRLKRITGPTLELLETAAVVGREIDPQLIAAVVSRSVSEVATALRGPGARDLLTESRQQRFRFRHELVREALYADIGPTRRAELHRSVAVALEQFSEDEDAPIDELAHHFMQASLGETPRRAALYAARAGRQAMERLAFEDAEGLFRRALGLFPGTEQAERCELLLCLGDAQVRGTGRSPISQGTFFEAAHLARALGDAQRLGRAALGFAGTGALVGRVDEETVDLLESAIGFQPETASTLSIALHSRLGAELQNSTDRERARKHGQQAVALARRLGDAGALAHALFAGIWDRLGESDLEEPLKTASEALRLAQVDGDPSSATLARNYRIRILLERGEIAAVRDEVDALEAWIHEEGLSSRQHHVHARRAMLTLLAGEFAEAERHVERGLDLAERSEDPAMPQVFAIVRYAIRREQGDLAPMEPALRAAAERYPQNWPWHCALAELYTRLDQSGPARRELGRIFDRPLSAMPRDGNWHISLVLLAEAAARLGDRERSATLYELLQPHAGRCAVAGSAAACLGSISRPLGLLAAAAGRDDRAVAHLDDALRENRALGARPWIVQTEAALLELRKSRGEDRAALRPALERTLAEARLLGLRPLVSSLEKALATAS